MGGPLRDFGDTAKGLARNPLGIIALFIVLVYGVAALVTGFSGSFSATERLPLIYFLVAFPVLVLGVFTWLVSRHSNKLFGPSDFKDEANYVKTLSATASLAVASVKSDTPVSSADINDVVGVVRKATESRSGAASGAYWRRHILWVDDRPANNIHERNAFENMGLTFTLALSTDEALAELEKQRFAVVISDMGRREGPQEGYVLLDRIREKDDQTPFFIYASSDSAEHKRAALARGAQGSTGRPQELFEMVMRAVVNR